MSDDPAARAAQEAAIYDSVQPRPAPEPAPVRPTEGRVATAVRRPASMGVTMGLLAVLMVASLVLGVSGLAMVSTTDGPEVVPFTAIFLGGSLLIWHIRALVMGSGRRTAMISPWPWVGLLVVSAYGLTLGFALFDLLTGVQSPARIALLSAGVVGMIAALVAFVRDADLAERARHEPVEPPASAPEPEPEPPAPVYFDPTGPDELRPRGVWPQPKRGTPADESLWNEVRFDDDEPIVPARRRSTEN